jgi:tripartite-type tricarboxylate transporter receptor subunit TctC
MEKAASAGWPLSPLTRVLAVVATICALGAAAISSAARAQPWPTRPVTIVVAFAPGGATDVLARIYSERLSTSIGQPVTVENKPGGSGSIAAGFALKSPADGHTLLAATSPTFTNAKALIKDLPYDPLKDFVAIALLGTQSFLLNIHAALPPNTLEEFVAYAKANPGKLNYGSPGVGTPHHLGMAHFMAIAGIDMVHVPYRGGALLMQEVLAGIVPVTFGSWVIAGPQIKNGKLKGLANSALRPITQAPHIPSIADRGYPGFDVEAWFGLVAIKGTPKTVMERLNGGIQAISQQEDVRQRLLTIGYDPPPSYSVDQFSARLERDAARWGKVISDIGIKPE